MIAQMVLDIINASASGATAVMLFVAVWQIVLERREQRIIFEDGFVREYRDLVAVLPLKAMLGQPLSEEPTDEELLAFYRYFDLCNQQAFMFKKGRIGPEAWADWNDGIRDNLKLPAFGKAWTMIKESRTDSFDELKKIEKEWLAAAVKPV